MKPNDAGALISEAIVEEVHQFSLLNTRTGAAQMKAKYDVATFRENIAEYPFYVHILIILRFFILGKC